MNYILCNPHDEYKTFIVSDMGPYRIGLDSKIYNRLSKYQEFYKNQDENAFDEYSFEGVHNFVSEQVSRIKGLDLNEDASVGLNGIICL